MSEADGPPHGAEHERARSSDPVLVKRAKLDRLATTGQRVGYLFLLVAVVAFFAGLAGGYGTWGTVVVVAMGLCTITLAPAIVLGYAVKAAAREDRQLNER